jgi:hypothetical protein
LRITYERCRSRESIGSGVTKACRHPDVTEYPLGTYLPRQVPLTSALTGDLGQFRGVCANYLGTYRNCPPGYSQVALLRSTASCHFTKSGQLNHMSSISRLSFRSANSNCALQATHIYHAESQLRAVASSASPRAAARIDSPPAQIASPSSGLRAVATRLWRQSLPATRRRHGQRFRRLWPIHE